MARWQRDIGATLDVLEAGAAELDGPVTIGTITVGCALGYLDFRYRQGRWRKGRPALTAGTRPGRSGRRWRRRCRRDPEPRGGASRSPAASAAPPDDEEAGDRHAPSSPRPAPNAISSERREQRRGIGEGAERPDVAALDAVVPEEEGGADRPEAEREDGQPLPASAARHGLLEQEMAERGEQRRRAAEAADRIARHAAEAAAQDANSPTR